MAKNKTRQVNDSMIQSWLKTRQVKDSIMAKKNKKKDRLRQVKTQ